LTPAAWLLYFTLFFWQFPHFMAIAWIYREDYWRASFRVLPLSEAGRLMSWQALLPSAALISVSMSQLIIARAAPFLIVIAGILNLAFFYSIAAMALRKSKGAARRTLLTSILYLPLIFIVTLLGKR
jgi:protoheme IX farnesyltransferase